MSVQNNDPILSWKNRAVHFGRLFQKAAKTLCRRNGAVHKEESKHRQIKTETPTDAKTKAAIPVY